MSVPARLSLTTVALLLLVGCGDEDRAGETASLQLPAGDPATQSCLVLSESVPLLAAMPVALAATVTDVSGGQVELSVQQWYAGDRGDTVVLVDAPPEQQVLLGAADFQVGREYLVSADPDGVVSTCGLTGPAEPALQSAYDEAFGG